LDKFTHYEQPSKYIVEQTDYDDSFEVPVLTAGQSFILGYTDERTGIYFASRENPVIIFDDFTTSFHWVDFPFKVKSSAMKILTFTGTSNANFRYIYHAMRSLRYQRDVSTHKRQWIRSYSRLEIPLPSLEEQERIVAILDKFDTLTTDISQGLPAEIEARQKQYEYYRDRLLTFEEVA